MARAEGTFDVTLQPLEDDRLPAGIGCLSIDKTFAGDLSGTSRGRMMSGAGTVEGSAGYVALERVTGVLAGRTGEFLLQHFGVMGGGNGRLVVEVVPDSATGELQGLAGTMSINASAGHTYVFDYELPGRP
jgi:hypothetical protein